VLAMACRVSYATTMPISHKNNLFQSRRLVIRKSMSRDAIKPFPALLFEILSRDEFSDIITWLPDGKAFTVHDRQKFIEVVSPCYFQETKFGSFLRKLNRWGFCRTVTASKFGAFYHKYFLRDYPSLCSKIRYERRYNRMRVEEETWKRDQKSIISESTKEVTAKTEASKSCQHNDEIHGFYEVLDFNNAKCKFKSEKNVEGNTKTNFECKVDELIAKVKGDTKNDQLIERGISSRESNVFDQKIFKGEDNNCKQYILAASPIFSCNVPTVDNTSKNLSKDSFSTSHEEHNSSFESYPLKCDVESSMETSTLSSTESVLYYNNLKAKRAHNMERD